MSSTPPGPTFPDTPDGVHDAGHRVFVGGAGPMWDLVGDLQLAFLRAQGITPATAFLDLACGSLRLGARLVPFLDRGRYVGLDKHVELILYGVMHELGPALFREKRPRFVVDGAFGFDGLPLAPEMAMAQSLFSHLNLADIGLCLARLRPAMAPGGRFFATFFEDGGTEPGEGRPREWSAADDPSHSWRMFAFRPAQMEAAGRAAGWAPRYLGDWNHPRGQRMMEYRAG